MELGDQASSFEERYRQGISEQGNKGAVMVRHLLVCCSREWVENMCPCNRAERNHRLRVKVLQSRSGRRSRPVPLVEQEIPVMPHSVMTAGA